MCLSYSVVDKLLSAGTYQFGESTLTVSRPPVKQPPRDGYNSDDVRKVRVSGIPQSMSTSILKEFLESSRVNGGEIEDLKHETGQDTAVVTFVSSDG